MSKKLISLFTIAALLVSLFPHLGTGSVTANNSRKSDEDLVLWYTFDQTRGTTVVDQSGNGNDGTFEGGANWESGYIGNAVDLNGKDGFVNLPDGLLSDVNDVTISAWVKVDQARNFQRIFDFGIDTNKNMFLTPHAAHSNAQGLMFAITTSGNQQEDRVAKGSAVDTNVWTHVALVIDGSTGSLYENGVEVARNDSLRLKPSDLGETVQNYIGKSIYAADPYLDGQIDDFRIYRRALNKSEIKDLIHYSDEEFVTRAKEVLDLGDINAVTDDLNLPTKMANGVNISWKSSDEDIVGIDGKVVRPENGEGNATVTLTATIRKGLASEEKVFTLTVLEKLSDAEAVAAAKEALDLGDTSAVTSDLTLPTKGIEDVTISWESSNTDVVDIDGTVTRPENGAGDATVELTATISKGSANDTKKFTINVLQLPPVSFNLNVNTGEPSHTISPHLYGIFYEDINYAADGGLYAELVQNRSFEFDNHLWSWSKVTKGNGAGEITVESSEPLNENNKHYVRLTIEDPGNGVGISNTGFDGIAIKEGEHYDFSFYARSKSNFSEPFTISLVGADGTVYGQTKISGITKNWKKYDSVIKVSDTDDKARLEITTLGIGTVDLDMISLFPQNTWNNRSNGLRYDLVKMLDELNPSFIRFPGGCLVGGANLDNRYRWKDTIGDVAERPINWNFWRGPAHPHYYQSYGLGFHEYFLLAEDIGAEPLPVIDAAMSNCGDQSLAPPEELEQNIQDALDLIEYANGPVTSEWGAKRAANGHPEPFNLKYLAIGNENTGRAYHERYELFQEAIKEKYPDIQLIISSGWAPDGREFDEAWEWVESHPTDIVDEHYYRSPEWFLNNVNRYDNYDRSGPKVIVGEYAAHGSGRRNNLESAIAEAAFMTGLERNSDVVVMASYAPLFAKENMTQWTPDLIWFNNSEVYGTPNYYVQQMFSQNRGDVILPSALTKPGEKPYEIKGGIGLGSWATQVEYDDVIVMSNDDTLLSEDFSSDLSQWEINLGDWEVVDGVLKQTSNIEGTGIYAGASEWTDYTLTLKARKSGGSEGMLISFGVKDTDNYYWWNLGGWQNTQHAIEKSVNGNKQIIGKTVPGKIETNRWYDIKIEVSGNRIRCYLDGELIHDVVDQVDQGPIYSVTSMDEESGDIVIKAVNTSNHEENVEIVIDGNKNIEQVGTVTTLTSDDLQDENSFEDPQKVSPVTQEVKGLGETFNYVFPKNSVTILRLKTESEVDNAADIKRIVERLEQEGEFASHDAAHALKVHLTAVSRYEEKQLADKVVKHMKSFKLLLDHQKDKELISEKAYNTLMTNSDDLIKKWQQ